MQDNKEHLNVDLGFLDEAKPQEVKTKTASAYKTNWRNIAIIGGLVAALIIWIAASDNAPSNRSAPSSYQPPASAYQTPGTDAVTVGNGEFRCSSYDSGQADLMAPKNEYEITQEEENLKRQNAALDSLKAQIDSSSVNQYSDQFSIDNYNGMVDRYNAQVTSLKSQYAAHQARVEVYNQQVQARNNYLQTHCRRSH